MKFADKLFFSMTAVLAVIFTVFGSWMLASYFQNALNREIEQGKTESQMYQYLFEMAYYTMEEYGNDYAVFRAIESVVGNVENDDVRCVAFLENGNFIYGKPDESNEELTEIIMSLSRELEGEYNYIYGIRSLGKKYYLIHICKSITSAGEHYLGVIRDLTAVYEERSVMINQYRFALVLLLLIGAGWIYLLSRWITKPIRSLGSVATKIADGDYEERSRYRGVDEIGALSASFNRMADRLVEQMLEKETQARQKEDFTAAFAHELKTPLTSIIGYADMLRSMPLSESERQEAYYYIYSQGKRLESLSHKLLELVSLEKQGLCMREIPTRQIEEAVKATIRPILKERKVKGRVIMERGVLYGDYELLLSLFYNLLDNAIKAVPEGGFILMKGMRLQNGYEVKVVDNGRGIPREEIARITEAFYMVDKSRSRKEGGAGIGMALCKQIISLHNGILKIDSKPGEGTIVRVFFSYESDMVVSNDL